MQVSQCEKCPHRCVALCVRVGVPIAKIKGCSLSPAGKKFFKARNPKEAIRLRISDRKGENK